MIRLSNRQRDCLEALLKLGRGRVGDVQLAVQEADRAGRANERWSGGKSPRVAQGLAVLCRAGLVEETREGSFFRLTPEGEQVAVEIRRATVFRVRTEARERRESDTERRRRNEHEFRQATGR